MHANLGTNHFGEIDPKKWKIGLKKFGWGGVDQVVQFFTNLTFLPKPNFYYSAHFNVVAF